MPTPPRAGFLLVIYMIVTKTGGGWRLRHNTETKRLTLPDLAIGAVKGIGEGVPNTMRLVTDNALGHIIPETGHWIAEEAPMQVLAALQPFLAPYRKAAAG
jgi:hypothetical protein